MNKTHNIDDKKDKACNPDPITGAHGAHPVGTGIGAAAGGAATGAVVGTMAGPVGTVIGAGVGAVIGGLAGKGVAEAVNPTIEDAYWRKNHSHQAYANGRPYNDFSPAYRNGYEGYAKYGTNGEKFEDRESDLRETYESAGPNLAWSDGRAASRAAWQRSKDRCDANKKC